MEIKVGVIEDINDPILLGRVRVRIIGLHTSDKQALPTSSLPWSIPLNPASQISGIGQSGCNFLCGSWVIVAPLDDAWQTTIIFGAFSGIPQDVQNVLDISGKSVDKVAYKVDGDYGGLGSVPAEKGGSTIPPQKDSSPQAIGPLSSDDVNKLKETIKKNESGGNYSALNQLGFIGAYQFGGGALVDGGYCRKGTTNKDLKYPECWLGKGGVVSRDTWFTHQEEQEKAMDALLARNFKTIFNKGLLRNDSDKDKTCGVLMVAHLQGAGGAAKWLRGGYVKADANGTTCEKYYNCGHKALANKDPDEIRPSVESMLPLSTAKGKAASGFADPNVIYPKRSLIKEQDNNRLARAQALSETIVGVKEAGRTKNTRMCGSQNVWDQPIIPANPTYPYNSVMATRAGIVTEYDSTPDNVRIHTFHPSGTFSEIDNNGTKVNKIVGDHFTIIERNGNVLIKGNLNITVEGDCNLLVQNDMNAEVYGDANIISKNDLNITSHGQCAMYVQEDFSIKAKSFSVETFGGDINMLSSANIDNKCMANHMTDAGGNIAKRSEGSFSVAAASTMSLNSTGAFSAVSSATMALKSSGALSTKSGGNINMDGSTIHMQEGASADPALLVIPKLDPAEMRTLAVDAEGKIINKVLPSTPEAVHIRDLTSTGTYSYNSEKEPVVLPVNATKLTRQEKLANDVGVIPPTGGRYDGSSRRYESPEDMDDGFQSHQEDVMSKSEHDPNEAVPTVKETHIPPAKGDYLAPGVTRMPDPKYGSISQKTGDPGVTRIPDPKLGTTNTTTGEYLATGVTRII